MKCATELGFNVGVEGHEWGADNASQQTDMSNNATAEFRVQEIIGCTVSWHEITSSQACYGMVLSVDVEAETALVRTISILSEFAGSYERLFRSQPFTQADKSIQIRANDTGSTIWMPLSQLCFVSGKAAENDSYEFAKTLISSMKDELESYKARCRKAEIERERFMVELSMTSLPLPESINDQSAAPPLSQSTLPPASASPPVYSRQSSQHREDG